MEPATPLESLENAIRIVGSQAALAKLCGVSQPAVFHWVHRSKKVPAEHVLPIEQETGVSRHNLRPDIYPVEAPHA